MKNFLLILILSLSATLAAQAQTTSASNTRNTVSSPDANVNFRLYQTNNRWTFLKLDTRTGIINHVQYSTNDNNIFQYALNTIPLATGEEAIPGRFFLYPTENTFNFILLDQIDGRVWQVQWNIDEKNRGIWRIY
ncbi:MAG: hypothetical protein NC335_09970 [Bacteroides sp.]|nr:hypothetical protein [Bacteroides sp.]